MEIKFTIKQVVAVGIGAALFVVIGMIKHSDPCSKYKHPASVCGTALLSIYFWTDYRFACRGDWSCNQGLYCWIWSVVDLDYR